MIPNTSDQALKTILQITNAMDDVVTPKEGVEKYAYITLLIGFGCFIVAAALSAPFLFSIQDKCYGSNKEIVANLGLGLLGVCYFVITSYGIYAAVSGFKYFKEFLKVPHRLIMKNVEKTARQDSMIFAYLLDQHIDNLRYVLVHLEAEYEDFHSRTTQFIGAISNIGIFPALLAYISLVQKLEWTSNQFIQIIVYVTPCFYFLSFYEVFIRGKMRRQIELLKLAIENISEGSGNAKFHVSKTDQHFELKSNEEPKNSRKLIEFIVASTINFLIWASGYFLFGKLAYPILFSREYSFGEILSMDAFVMFMAGIMIISFITYVMYRKISNGVHWLYELYKREAASAILNLNSLFLVVSVFDNLKGLTILPVAIAYFVAYKITK